MPIVWLTYNHSHLVLQKFCNNGVGDCTMLDKLLTTHVHVHACTQYRGNISFILQDQHSIRLTAWNDYESQH